MCNKTLAALLYSATALAFIGMAQPGFAQAYRIPPPGTTANYNQTSNTNYPKYPAIPTAPSVPRPGSPGSSGGSSLTTGPTTSGRSLPTIGSTYMGWRMDVKNFGPQPCKNPIIYAIGVIQVWANGYTFALTEQQSVGYPYPGGPYQRGPVRIATATASPATPENITNAIATLKGDIHPRPNDCGKIEVMEVGPPGSM